MNIIAFVAKATVTCVCAFLIGIAINELFSGRTDLARTAFGIFLASVVTLIATWGKIE
jgi:hypothetical protein